MPLGSRMRFTLAVGIFAASSFSWGIAYAQSETAAETPTNDAPNPYRTIEGWAKLPNGRKWGSTSAVAIDKDGKSVWIAERCGANSCLDRATGQIKENLDPVLEFDSDGNLLKSFGSGMFVAPHGIYVDKDDNIWVTDYQDNAPAPAGGRGRGRGEAREAPTGPVGPRPGATKGSQVYKFNKDGKLLMTLGTPGGAAEPGYFYAPNAVIVAPNGDIFVAEGHGAGNNRILKFTKDGKLIKSWGKMGTGPGEFNQPHALAFDTKGRLFVADRGNNRLQIFDQDGNFLGQMTQFSRPSGVFIDKKDNIYVADSESGSVNPKHAEWKRGIRIGNLKDGKVVAFIPDPDEHPRNTSAAEGVAVDAKGDIYGAEVGPMDVKKYVKK